MATPKKSTPSTPKEKNPPATSNSAKEIRRIKEAILRVATGKVQTEEHVAELKDLLGV